MKVKEEKKGKGETPENHQNHFPKVGYAAKNNAGENLKFMICPVSLGRAAIFLDPWSHL